MDIQFILSPAAADIETIYNGLVDFNSGYFSDLNEIQCGIFVRQENGSIVGGLTGRFLYTTFHIQYLWVAKEYRFKGLGKTLMNTLESEVKPRGTLSLCVDTYTFQAPDFYKQHGFLEV